MKRGPSPEPSTPSTHSGPLIPGRSRSIHPAASSEFPSTAGRCSTIAPSEPRRVAGGAWLSGDVLLVTGRAGGGIHRISVHGGDSQLIEAGGGWPHALPDGRGFLYASAGGIYAGSIARCRQGTKAPGGQTDAGRIFGWAPAVRARSHPRSPSRSIRSTQPRCPARPFPVAHSLLTRELGSTRFTVTVDETVTFSVDSRGVLAYAAGEAPNRLRWRGRSGKAQGEVGEPGNIRPLAFRPMAAASPSQGVDRAATPISGSPAADRTRIVRLTFDPVVDWYPSGRPTGKTITFSSGPRRHRRRPIAPISFVRKAADGTGPAEQLTFDRGAQHAMDWSSDGRFLSVHEEQHRVRYRSEILPPFDQRKPYVFLQPTSARRTASSRLESAAALDRLLVRRQRTTRDLRERASCPASRRRGARWQVSREGGRCPAGAATGRSCSTGGWTDESWRSTSMAIRPRVSGRHAGGALPGAHADTADERIEFDVTRDGQRFLLIEPSEQTTFQSLVTGHELARHGRPLSRAGPAHPGRALCPEARASRRCARSTPRRSAA